MVLVLYLGYPCTKAGVYPVVNTQLSKTDLLGQ